MAYIYEYMVVSVTFGQGHPPPYLTSQNVTDTKLTLQHWNKNKIMKRGGQVYIALSRLPMSEKTKQTKLIM